MGQHRGWHKLRFPFGNFALAMGRPSGMANKLVITFAIKLRPRAKRTVDRGHSANTGLGRWQLTND
jgi:hypothetical protein